MIIDDDDNLCTYENLSFVVMIAVYAFIIFLMINIRKIHYTEQWIYEP